MAIRTVVTRGYGNGTFNGTIALVVTSGYAIGVPVVIAGSISLTVHPRDSLSLVARESLSVHPRDSLTVVGEPV